MLVRSGSNPAIISQVTYIQPEVLHFIATTTKMDLLHVWIVSTALVLLTGCPIISPNMGILIVP